MGSWMCAVWVLWFLVMKDKMHAFPVYGITLLEHVLQELWTLVDMKIVPQLKPLLITSLTSCDNNMFLCGASNCLFAM